MSYHQYKKLIRILISDFSFFYLCLKILALRVFKSSVPVNQYQKMDKTKFFSKKMLTFWIFSDLLSSQVLKELEKKFFLDWDLKNL